MPDYFTLLRDRVRRSSVVPSTALFLQAYVPKLQTVGQVDFSSLAAKISGNSH